MKKLPNCVLFDKYRKLYVVAAASVVRISYYHTFLYLPLPYRAVDVSSNLGHKVEQTLDR